MAPNLKLKALPIEFYEALKYTAGQCNCNTSKKKKKTSYKNDTKFMNQ